MSDHHKPKPRRWQALRATARLFLATIGILVGLAALGWLASRFGVHAAAVDAFLTSNRRYFQVGQLVGVAAIWWYWKPIIAWLGRRSRRPDAPALPVLMRFRHRIGFLLLIVVLLGLQAG